MPATAIALYLFFFLLPGFISQRFSQALAHQKERAELDKVVDAFVLTGINLLIFLIVASLLKVGHLSSFLRIEPLSLQMLHFEETDRGNIILNFYYGRNIVALLGMSILVGLAHGTLLHHGFYYKFFKKLRLTNLTGRLCVWNDAFNCLDNEGAWVRVALEDGSYIQGFAKYFSDFGDLTELYFKQIEIKKPDGTTEIIPVKIFRSDGACENYPGVLLTQKEIIKRVYFFPRSIDCSKYVFFEEGGEKNVK